MGVGSVGDEGGEADGPFGQPSLDLADVLLHERRHGLDVPGGEGGALLRLVLARRAGEDRQGQTKEEGEAAHAGRSAFTLYDRGAGAKLW